MGTRLRKETYVRRNGKLTPASPKALAAQIEKLMAQNSALYMDYKEAKAKDAKKDGYADTWQGALWRWARVIQEVRDIVGVGAKYGNLKQTRTHTYRDDGSAEDVGTMELRKTAGKLADSKATTKSAMKTTSTSFSTVESSTAQKPIANHAGQTYRQTGARYEHHGRERYFCHGNSNVQQMWTDRSPRGSLPAYREPKIQTPVPSTSGRSLSSAKCGRNAVATALSLRKLYRKYQILAEHEMNATRG